MGRRTGVDGEARRGALATLLAAALHIGVLCAVSLVDVPSAPPARAPATGDGSVTIELTESLSPEPGAEAAIASHAAATGPRKQGTAPVARRHMASFTPPRESASSADSSSDPGKPVADSAKPQPKANAGPRPSPRRVELGLGGKATSSLLLASRGRDAMRPPRKSVGLLQEGLAELDARRGIGPSGAAVSAASRAAAALGPSRGIAVFDVRTNAKGLVTGVTLIRFGSSSQAWSAVARRMEAALRGRRLPLGRGSKGSITRLQVATGQEAKGGAGPGRTKRRAALGQGPRQRNDIARDESTRAIMDGPTPSPTLGKKVVGSSTARRVRVSIVSTRSLGG